jgi:predicted alpha/beta-fold hydrolase
MLCFHSNRAFKTLPMATEGNPNESRPSNEAGLGVNDRQTDDPFRPAWWLSNRHLQTIWPVLCRARIRLETHRERLELPDGDFLDVDWVGREGPIVIVLHGLQGSAESNYARGLLKQIEARGWRGALMHFRGCSGEANRLPRSYHSGETADVDWFARELRRREPETPLAGVAYSLGGNVLLKWLGESGTDNPLKAAVAVSIPFELGTAADSMESGFARVYQWYLVRKLKKALRAKIANGSFELPLSGADLDRLRSFREFDGAVTAPMHGFRSAQDYYERCSSRQFVDRIETPTLVLHAADDPLMRSGVIPPPEERSAHVAFEISPNGGHVGFVSGSWPWSAQYWLEDRIPKFLEAHID